MVLPQTETIPISTVQSLKSYIEIIYCKFVMYVGPTCMCFIVSEVLSLFVCTRCAVYQVHERTNQTVTRWGEEN